MLKNVSIMSLNVVSKNYSLEYIPTESSTEGTLLSVANYLSYKTRSNLSFYKKMNENLL